MFSTASRKQFVVKSQVDRHFDFKSYRILLNTMILSLRCFGLWTSYITKCAKSSQFFTTASMHDTITSWQILWFSDFICIFQNLKTIQPHVGDHVSRTRCLKFLFISQVWPQTEVNNINIIFLLILFYYSNHLKFKIDLIQKNYLKCN